MHGVHGRPPIHVLGRLRRPARSRSHVRLRAGLRDLAWVGARNPLPRIGDDRRRVRERAASSGSKAESPPSASPRASRLVLAHKPRPPLCCVWVASGDPLACARMFGSGRSPATSPGPATGVRRPASGRYVVVGTRTSRARVSPAGAPTSASPRLSRRGLAHTARQPLASSKTPPNCHAGEPSPVSESPRATPLHSPDGLTPSRVRRRSGTPAQGPRPGQQSRLLASTAELARAVGCRRRSLLRLQGAKADPVCESAPLRGEAASRRAVLTRGVEPRRRESDPGS